jgi:hypothetical protein
MLGKSALWLALSIGMIAGCGPKGGEDDTDTPADDTTGDTDVAADTDIASDTDVATDTDVTTDTDVVEDTDVEDTDPPDPRFVDSDGDTFTPAQGDCDDTNDQISPDQVEVYYDGVDANCDAASDYDADGDGFDATAWGGEDCDDEDATVSPDQLEVYYDGVDGDCDGASDFDADGDTYDSSDYGGDDCDDGDAMVYLGATDEWYDGVDANCAEDDDYDADGDGSRSVDYGGEDCDDADPEVYLGAVDTLYDGTDSDCQGDSDYDGDHDGYDSSDFSGTDCDDTNFDVNPVGTEYCNDIDDDCDGDVDEPDSVDARTYYLDSDGDGYGAGASFTSCDLQVDWTPDDGDCDDTEPGVYPTAPSIACDGFDNDCEPTTEENAGGAYLGGSMYEMLADALGDANPGDVVEVCEGRHFVQGYEPPGALTIQARFPSTILLTTLDADGLDSVFEIRTTAPVELRGLRLVNGKGTLTSGERQGGAIWAGDDTDLTLTDCSVTQNRAGKGGGIWIGADARLTLVRTYLIGNSGDSTGAVVPRGGNLSVGARSFVEMEDSLLMSGSAAACGGVDLGADATLLGAGAANILNNTAQLNGGGVCADNSATLTGITIDGNTAATGAGLYGVDVALNGCRVRSNVASLLGGGLALSGSSSVVDGEVTANQAGVGVGGIDLAFATSTLVLETTRVANNVSTFFAAHAGGVEIHGGTLTSTSTDWGTLSDNSPADISLSVDGRTYNYAGSRTFTCDDGTGAGCL